MKIQPLSDLHLEFGPFDFPTTDADVVVLAGDIGVGNSHYKIVEQWCAAHPEKQFIIIAGNHEFYGYEMLDNITHMRMWAVTIPNLHFLDNDCITIGGVHFVGCTLWTDMDKRNPNSMICVNYGMNDFNLIQFNNGVRFQTHHAAYLFDKSLEFLNNNITTGCVVITHHAPSYQSNPREFRSSKIAPGYCSDLDNFILAAQPSLWIHGHIHTSLDYQIADTRIICNPRGYVGHELNPGFNPSLVIELDTSHE